MADVQIPVILALREAAERLDQSTRYQWGHMGNCNCGFLVQVVTGRTAANIHASAMTGMGDWSEQLNDFCPTTGLAMDCLIGEMLAAGFSREDLVALERLSDPTILALLPEKKDRQQYNRKEDVVAYLRAWAHLLEEQWLSAQPAVAWAAITGEKAEVERECSPSPRFPD